MARVAVNPEVLSATAPLFLPKQKIRAVDGDTWKKGEMGFMTSGEIEPVVAAGKTDAYAIFAQDQATSTSSTDVWVRRLVAGARLYMFVMTNGTAATAATAVEGTAYGVRTLANVCYLDTGTANGQFKVIRDASNAQPFEDTKKDMDAAPGKVEVEFLGYVS
ncbi:unnamed protein product [marine sediment metagenome]|uniref:Uncharacterized protein n=1 Tax=marine sediment metagenome TaxID=412755 RepID=X0U7H3_9ZZZZ